MPVPYRGCRAGPGCHRPSGGAGGGDLGDGHDSRISQLTEFAPQVPPAHPRHGPNTRPSPFGAPARSAFPRSSRLSRSGQVAWRCGVADHLGKSGPPLWISLTGLRGAAERSGGCWPGMRTGGRAPASGPAAASGPPMRKEAGERTTPGRATTATIMTRDNRHASARTRHVPQRAPGRLMGRRPSARHPGRGSWEASYPGNELLAGRGARWLLLMASVLTGLLLAVLTVHQAGAWTGLPGLGH